MFCLHADTRKLYNFIDQINSLSGNKKIEHLQELKKSDDLLYNDFIDFSRIVLDPKLSFYITGVIADPYQSVDHSLLDALILLDRLDFKGSADDKDHIDLIQIYSAITQWEKNLVDMVLARNLKCGLSIKSIQKVQKDFLPKFPVMKCSAYDLKKIKKINFPAISSLKADGARCIAVIKQDEVSLHSGNGNKFHNLDHITNEIKPSINFVLDGELVVVDENNKILPRKTGNGILNKSIKGTITEEEALRVRYITWDIIDIDIYFNKTKENRAYLNRLTDLTILLDLIKSEYISIIECRWVDNLTEAKEHFRELTLRGEEGTILKDPASLWKNKRVTDQIKFKEEFPCDLQITGWYYGKKGTKFERCIGGFNVKTSDGLVQCNVGSGLSDADRGLEKSKNMTADEFMQWANNYIFSFATISYNSRETSENKQHQSLFLPRLVEFRFDKDHADSLETLIQQEQASREVI